MITLYIIIMFCIALAFMFGCFIGWMCAKSIYCPLPVEPCKTTDDVIKREG